MFRQTVFALKAAILVTLPIVVTSSGLAQSPIYEILYSFKGGADGASPSGGLTLGKSGALYGTTQFGGANSCPGNGSPYLCGTVFVLAPSPETPWAKTVIHSFNGNDGAVPGATMSFSSTGSLFGTTEVGGAGSGGAPSGGGTVFSMTPPATAGEGWTESTLYSFTYSDEGPNTVYSGVLIGPGERLFGTTHYSQAEDGGVTGGVVFMLAAPATSGGTWSESTLLNFWGLDLGLEPYSGLVSEGGSLYGTTYFANGDNPVSCGVVYEVTPPATSGAAWTGGVVYAFSEPPNDGCNPRASLTVGPDGVLYGTTRDGGTGAPCNEYPMLGCGTVFQLTPPVAPGGTWTESILYNFSGVNGDGAYPYASLVLGKNGVLYGTTQYGGSAETGSPCFSNGASGCGTVFSLTPPATAGQSWTETIPHSFTGENGDGAQPLAGLAIDSNGILYGTTSAGGTAGVGTVFAIKP